jgi:hypothetical protein
MDTAATDCPGCPPGTGVRTDAPVRHHTPGCPHAPHCPGCHTVGDDRGHLPTCPCAYNDHQIPATIIDRLRTVATALYAADRAAQRCYSSARLVDLRSWLHDALTAHPEPDDWTVARRIQLIRAALDHREATEWPGGRRNHPCLADAASAADETGPRYITVSGEPHVWQVHDTHLRETLPGRYDQATADQMAADLNAPRATDDTESRVP